MSLDEVMQAASEFMIVQGAFGWLVDNHPRLADWNAGARRTASLMMSLDGLERAEPGDGLAWELRPKICPFDRTSVWQGHQPMKI